MVSKARDDLPEPLRPVITVRLSRGISTSMPLRLCSRAPRTEIWVCILPVLPICSRAASGPAMKERAGLDGGPRALVNQRGGIVGDRFIVRAVAAKPAF